MFTLDMAALRLAMGRDNPDLSAFPDGERFLAVALPTSEQNDPAVIHVMLNAHERLKQIAPVPED